MASYGGQRDFDRFTMLQIILGILCLIAPDTPQYITRMIKSLNGAATKAGHAEACATDNLPHGILLMQLGLHLFQLSLSVFENGGLYNTRFNQEYKAFLAWMKIFLPVAVLTDVAATVVGAKLLAAASATQQCPSLLELYFVFDIALSFLKLPAIFVQFSTDKRRVAQVLNESVQQLYRDLRDGG